LPRADVSVFFSGPDPPTGVNAFLQGAAIQGQASAPSASQTANPIDVNITGAAIVGNAGSSVTETGTILWNGDYSTGDFLQWHVATDSTRVQYSQIPSYGRPVKMPNDGAGRADSYYGNGDLMSMVATTARTVNGHFYPQGPTRGSSPYAAKITLKNSINGTEVGNADCDPAPTTCNRRRADLTVQKTMQDDYNAFPPLAERWLSCSIYIPADFDGSGPVGGGFGIKLWSMKDYNDTGPGPISISIEPGEVWRLGHRWQDDDPYIGLPWWQQMWYTGDEPEGSGLAYPRADFWPDGTAHFPDLATSHAALQSLNKGGWTDWIVHMKMDHRGSDEGGTGFIKIWKREDQGAWIYVLDVFPGELTRGGHTFNHGVGFHNNITNGYGIKCGAYCTKDRVWDLPENTVIYNANVKVGDENATFAQMSPDGSQP